LLQKLKAIIFDFDGTILDTEYPDFLALSSIYDEYSLELPFELFQKNIGTHEPMFDPYGTLCASREVGLTRDQFIEETNRRKGRILERALPMPGVMKLISEAKNAGVMVAIGSSSPLIWVGTLSRRIGIADHFEHMVTRDDVSKTKPSPEIFNLTVEKLGVGKENCIVLEDSLNGITAANAAGIRSLWIPNEMTKSMPVSPEHPRVESLESVTLEMLDQLL